MYLIPMKLGVPFVGGWLIFEIRSCSVTQIDLTPLISLSSCSLLSPQTELVPPCLALHVIFNLYALQLHYRHQLSGSL